METSRVGLCDFGSKNATTIFGRFSTLRIWHMVQAVHVIQTCTKTMYKQQKFENAVARIFESRGLLCSVTKRQLPSDDTLYIFLPAWTWKVDINLHSLYPSCPSCLASYPALPSCLVLSPAEMQSKGERLWLRVNDAKLWAQIFSSNRVMKFRRQKPVALHELNTVSFDIGYICSCFRIAGLAEVDSYQKTQSSLCLTRIYVFLVVLSIVREIQRNVPIYHQNPTTMCAHIARLYRYMNISCYDIWLLRHDFLTHSVLQDLKLAQLSRSHNHAVMAGTINKPRSETFQNFVQEI